MTYIPLKLYEKRTAINLWNRQNPDDKLVANQPGAYRKMLPMVINGDFQLVCPDTGYSTEKIPKKIIDNYLKQKNEVEHKSKYLG